MLLNLKSLTFAVDFYSAVTTIPSACRLTDLLGEAGVESLVNPPLPEGSSNTNFEYPVGTDIITYSITSVKSKTLKKVELTAVNVEEVTVMAKDSSGTTLRTEFKSPDSAVYTF